MVTEKELMQQDFTHILHQPQPRMGRPRSVTTFVLLVLLIAVLHLTRLGQSLEKWQLLQTVLPFNPIYLALHGLIWGAGGLGLAWGWWNASPWAPGAARWMAIIFSLNIWFERIFLAGSPDRNINWPFIALLNAAILLWLFWQIRSKALRTYFGEIYVS